jgi:membrane protein DedA with SNARE-associated domain
VISGLHDFFSHLTYDISFAHPLNLAILLALGILTEIGVPLLFTLEIFLLFAAYYLGPLSIQVLLIVSMILLGRESGASVLFLLSRLLGEPFLNWLKRHFGWIFRNLDQIRERIKKHTILMVTVVRLTPGFLQIPSIVSGSLGLQYSRFVLGVAISSLIYDVSLVLFGFIARVAFNKAPENLKDYFIIFFVVSIIFVWVVLVLRFRHVYDKGKIKH